MLSMANFGVTKLIENHNGIAHVKAVGAMPMQVPIQIPIAAPINPIAAPPAPTPAPSPIKLSFLDRLQLALRIIVGRAGI